MSIIFGILGVYNQTQASTALKTFSYEKIQKSSIKEDEHLLFSYQTLQKDSKRHEILLSFDGEIFNTKELKRQLNLETDSQEQIIIAAYTYWGEKFVEHLRGKFLIALVDGQTLYLFRDRFGTKSLFYLHESSFVFASQLKAIVPFLKKKEMDDDALLSYLSFLSPTPPFTFFKGIKKLAAGEYLVYKNQSVVVKRHYDILDTPPNAIVSKEEALVKLESALEESMYLHLHTDLPIAALLSGGIDSATINYYAKKQNLNIPTYTLGYKEFAKYDERANATATASFLGIKNTAIEIDAQMFISASERVLASLDEPLNDPAAIPLSILFEKIKGDGYAIVLSGEGSDELFLGYRQYFEYLDIENAATLKHKNWLKKYFVANFSMNREWEWYKRIFDETLLFRTSGEKFTDLQKNDLMRRNVKDNASLKYLNSYREKFLSSKHSDESMWYSYIDLNLFQGEHFLTKLEHTSSANLIESRTPFLDEKLVATVFSLSPKLRYEDGITKSLLKDLMREKLDASILTRRKKGFANPYMEYLISSKKISLIQEVNAQTGLFKADKLDEYIKTASSGSFKQHIWGLYVLSHWIKRELL